MTERYGAVIRVEWGDEYHALTLRPEDWSRVKGGQRLQIKGEGYGYDGEFFQDYWTFEGGLDGRLLVTYGEGLDEGVGWDGKLVEADIEEGTTDPSDVLAESATDIVAEQGP